MTENAVQNTDRELWREESGLPADPDNYYGNSIHVTAQGGIGISVGGHVIVMPLRDWHKLAVRARDDLPRPSNPPRPFPDREIA